MTGLGRLSLNQATVKNLTLEQATGLCLRHEIPAIGLWRDRVAELGLARAAAAVHAAGPGSSSAPAPAASSKTRMRCSGARRRSRPPSIAKCGCRPFSQARNATPTL